MIERIEENRPALLPFRDQVGPGDGSVLEFFLAMAPRFLAVRGEEVGGEDAENPFSEVCVV